MFYHKSTNPSSAYRDSEGVRWDVDAIPRPDKDARPLCEEFDTLEEALETWGLTYAPLPEPKPEPEN